MRPAIVLTILTAAPAFGTPSPEAPALRRPPALRTEDVPELPEALFEELHRYQEVRSAAFEDWHPAGGVIFSSRIGNLSQLYHAREPEGTPVQLTAGLEPVTDGRALPDGSIVFSMARGGDENYQVYRLERPGAEPRLLTDGKSRNLLGPTDREGRRIAFTSTKRNGRDADVHVLHAASGAVDLLLEVNNETWSVEDWSHDGSEVLLSRYVSASESYGFLFELPSKKKTPLPPEDESAALPTAKVQRSVLCFGPGSKSIYVVSDARGEFRELARLDRGTGKYAWLTKDLTSDVENLELSPDGKLAAFTTNAEGWSRLWVLDLGRLEREGEAAAREARTEVDLGRAIASGLKFSSDSARLGFTLGGAARPPEAFSIALPSGKPLRWTRSTLGGFDTRDFVEPEAFRYTSFDGRKIPALIFRPPPAKAEGGAEKKTAKVPVIVSIHGGPESQSRPTFHAFRQYLVRELGAAVITPNVRGSTGYGKSYARLDNGILREESVRDIGALLDWIAAEESLDASRVAVMGGSYGGYMTLASLVHFGERIRAGVDVVGISNFRTFLENTSPYRRELRRAEYGDERDPSIRAYLEKIAPANHVEKLRSALLVVHGDNDPRVPLSEAEKIAAGARASGKPVWTLYASNEGHGFTRRENRDYEETVTAAFLKRHLQGGEKVGVEQPVGGLPLEDVELGITCRVPRQIDVAAWVRTAKEAGAGYLVLPAEAFMTLDLRLRLGSHTDLPGNAAKAGDDVLLREVQNAVARPGPLAGLWIEKADDASKRLGADATLAHVHAPRAAVVLGNDGSVALGRNTGPHLESRASLRDGPSPHDGPEGLKPIEETILLHYQMVGRGANLLLELTPDARGGVLEAESARLRELTTELGERFARPAGSASGDGELIEVDLRGPRRIDHIVSMERPGQGWRVERYVLEGRADSAWSRIGSGTAIGRKKVDSFGPVVADRVRLRVLRSSGPPSFREVVAYDTGGAPRTRAGGGIPADELAAALKALAEQRLDDALRAADRALALAPAWTPAHRLRAEVAMARNDAAGVVKDLGVVLALEEPQGALEHLRATELFKLGRFAESTAGFNAAVEAGGAHTSDACWERGLARYYAGDAEGARQQFEGYHHVGPLDIENGLWAFLSEARRGGTVEERLGRARRVLPEYRDRRRPPFPALLDLYLGKGTVEAVFEEARGKTAPGPARDEGIFYAHLYAGKYLEAAGDAAGARKHLEEAARIPIDHFMALCAKAEVERLISGAR